MESKERPLDLSKLTLLRQNLKRMYKGSNHTFQREVPRGFYIKESFRLVMFEDRNLTLQQKQREQKKILPFVAKYHPAVPTLKQMLMNNWHPIRQQPLLREIYKDPPLILYRKGKFSKGHTRLSKITKRLKILVCFAPLCIVSSNIVDRKTRAKYG